MSSLCLESSIVSSPKPLLNFFTSSSRTQTPATAPFAMMFEIASSEDANSFTVIEYIASSDFYLSHFIPFFLYPLRRESI